MNYRLSPHAEIVQRDAETFLVSRTPLCILRINAPLQELARKAGQAPIAPSSAKEAALLEQLTERGFMVRERQPQTGQECCPTVSIVIPVKDRAEELQRCLASLAVIDYPKDRLELIVVDDGSRDASPIVASAFGATVIPSGGTGRGPAAARNVGARAAGGEILAFIDSDCTASEQWLSELLPAFRDAATAAVGGLVEGMCTESAVDRYEAVMSSLSLGSRERSGNSGNDTFYLPSCNLLVRRQDFIRAGGFRDEMHVGEDVDLTWRLRDSGRTISYLPLGRVFHEHRSSVRSFMSRRFDYGTSEGMLQRLHPTRRKRMLIPPLLATLLVMLAMTPLVGWWGPTAALLLLGSDTVLVRRRLVRHGLDVTLPAILAGRLRALGSLVYYLSFHLVRYYSIPACLAALALPWLWIPFATAIIWSARVDFSIKKPALGFPGFTAIYLLEHLAYGSGVFWGCARRGTFSSYRISVMRTAEHSA